MKQEYSKVLIWPRQTKDANPPYRYVIIGMIVTDKQINGLNSNEVVIEGYTGIAECLESCSEKGRDPRIKTGDAANVLVNLEDL